MGEIIKDGYNGIMIPSDFTDEEFAEKIKTIIVSNKAERQQMRDNARQFWNDNFNSRVNYTQFAENI